MAVDKETGYRQWHIVVGYPNTTEIHSSKESSDQNDQTIVQWSQYISSFKVADWNEHRHCNQRPESHDLKRGHMS